MSDSSGQNRLAIMKEALLELKAMRAKVAEMERAQSEPIAIIGMACRIPGGANTPDAFWKFLEAGTDAVTEVPAERWSWREQLASADGAAPDRRAVQWGAFLKDVDRFDARFFGISDREASTLDPQQRIALEVAWEALEHAGQVPEKLVGSRTGVFLGVTGDDYKQVCVAADPETRDVYSATGTSRCFPPGRLSYVLGLQGPSLVIDTACSSSLVAVHLACQSLRSGDSSLALVGGVNLMLAPLITNSIAMTGALSPEGRCRTFDAQANGFVRGEGCVMVVLKRLSDAEADGDTVLAVIRGSAVNQDGRSTGLTAPNVLSQQAMLRQALRNARVAPSDVTYIETHGTGTPLGDPIEIAALSNVFGAPRPDGSECVLGALKSNVGHLEASSGVAGLMKIVLALRHEAIPANLHFTQLNPRINLDGTPLVIAAERLPWKRGDKPRIAGVSSFGMSGTNAHVVLEEAPPVERAAPADVGESAYVLPLSARSPAALSELARAYQEVLTSDEAATSVRDIAFTASVRRSHHEHRLAVVGRTREELAKALEKGAALRDETRTQTTSADRPGSGNVTERSRVVFVFSGQGSQWAGMGRELLRDEPVFREAIERCDALLRRHVSWSLVDEMTAPAERSRLNRTEIAQPALFAIQVALVSLWRSWGISPDAVIGHSVGEVAAAWAAEALSLEDALTLVWHRGRVMAPAAGLGRMVAVEASAEVVARALEGHESRVGIAAINDPGAVVLSGAATELDEVMATLARSGVQGRALRVDYAFHSPQMAPFQAELARALAGLTVKRGALPMVSTVTGALVGDSQLDAAYWGKNLREPVNLAGAIDVAISDGYCTFVEVGPHPVALANIRQCLAHRDVRGLVVSSLRREREERRALLESVAALYARGHAIAWESLFPSAGRCVELPTYPWQRARHWVRTNVAAREGGERASAGQRDRAGAHPLLGVHFSVPTQPGTHFWERSALSAEAVPFLADHRVQGAVVVPGAAFVELALAAQATLRAEGAPALENVTFERMLSLPAEGTRSLQVVLTDEGGGRSSIQVFSGLESGADSIRPPAWVRHATATALSSADTAREPLAACESPAQIQARCPSSITGEELYASIAARGVQHGPIFRGVEQLWFGGEGNVEALGRVRVLNDIAGDARFRVHPALLDACMQVVALLFPVEGTVVPVAIESFALHERLGASFEVGATVWAHARRSEQELTADLTLSDERGRSLVEMKGLRFQRLASDSAARLAEEAWLHAIAWQRRDLAPARPIVNPEGAWLLFCDEDGIGSAVAAELGARGASCVRVVIGDGYAQLAPDLFQVRPASPDDIESVLRDAFGEASAPCRGVVHLFSVGASDPSVTTLDTLRADQDLGCLSALALTQALVRHSRRHGREAPRLWLVTRGAQQVTPADGVAVSQAPLWGFGRSLALEHPELACARIDLGSNAESTGALVRELESGDREDQIALRPEGRYVARLVRKTLDALSAGLALEPARGPVDHDRAAIRPDATYVITGGLGGLGLSLAASTVERGARHLVLVGRSSPSEGARAALRAMEEKGARVVVATCDVSSRADVAALLAQIDASLPPLRGIVHAAGVVEDNTIEHLSAEHFWKALSPKALGAWNLHELTRGRDLDFFVLYSSAASLFGSPGQANYAAGNAFLDALAHHRQALGLPGLSINWGVFSDLGLAAAQENRGARLASRGLQSITPAQGEAMLAKLLLTNAAQIGVVPIDAHKWTEFYPSAASSPFWSELLSEQDRDRAPRRSAAALREALLAAEPTKRRALLLPRITAQVEAALVCSTLTLDPSQSLLAMGLDSLIAIELSNRIQNELGIRLPVSELLKGPTIDQLAERALELLTANAGASVRTTPVLRSASTPSAPVTMPLPLSIAQQSIAFMDPTFADNPAWNVFIACRLTGSLDERALKESLGEIVTRHAPLRSRFPVVDGRRVQHIVDGFVPDVADVDLRGLDEDDREDEVSHLALEQSLQTFDLANGPVVRFTLVRTADEEHVLLLAFHHWVVDFWSVFVFLRELGPLYEAFSEGKPSPLPEVPVRYSDFIAWEQEWLEGASLETQSAFWRKTLDGCPASLALPTDDARVPASRRRALCKYFRLSPSLWTAVQEFSQREGATAYMTLLAAYNVLMHRSTGQEDMPVLSWSARRNQKELEELIGFFTGTVLMRTDLSGDPTFRELLSRVRRTTLDAFEHENMPLELQVKDMLAERGLSRLPLAAQSHFLYQPFPRPMLAIAGLEVELLDITHVDNGAPRVELEWVLWKHQDGLGGYVAYDDSIFDTATIRRMIDDFEALLTRVVKHPEERLSVLQASGAGARRGKPISPRGLIAAHADEPSSVVGWNAAE